MAAGSWARPAAERRIARTQLFVFVASWLWNHVASLVNATPFCRSHPRLVPMNTQSGILCDRSTGDAKPVRDLMRDLERVNRGEP
jgi:hypothetical protein